ncbi:MAG: acyl-CoA dehydrogenase family protein [Tepidiformaceae bacterium]
MDFRFSAEDDAWRNELRTWIRQEFGADWKGFSPKSSDPAARAEEEFEFASGVRKKLAQKGWTAPAWPKEYGGMGASFGQQAVFNEELSYSRVPGPDLVSVGYVGPTLMLYGTDEQKKHIPAITAADEVWCQGYSEPGSGSDLASLQTRAIRDGDDYVINGQKIWTSQAHRASWMFMLVRTDPDAPKHRGISYLLLDMKTPGITIRPLVNMLGRHEFNEVFFDNVRVPAQNRVGEENRGWYVGMATMDFERSAIGSSASLRRDFEDLIEYVRTTGDDGLGVSRRIARTELANTAIEIETGKMLSLRVLSMQQAGQVPNQEASIAKMYNSELGQRFARLGVRLLGLTGALREGSAYERIGGHFAESYMRTVPSTIAGGSSEIQRNIIATRGLGLPRG